MFAALDVDSSDDNDDNVNGIFQGPLHSWDDPRHGHNMLSYVKSDSRPSSIRFLIGGPLGIPWVSMMEGPGIAKESLGGSLGDCLHFLESMDPQPPSSPWLPRQVHFEALEKCPQALSFTFRESLQNP